ncbi:hypothetical protein EJ07DRAFT_151254 [Lizonia empirigonia]|nr:hypothetical protein EJ07DRAFT_151254 [Lizonia empirigonia]
MACSQPVARGTISTHLLKVSAVPPQAAPSSVWRRAARHSLFYDWRRHRSTTKPRRGAAGCPRVGVKAWEFPRGSEIERVSWREGRVGCLNVRGWSCCDSAVARGAHVMKLSGDRLWMCVKTSVGEGYAVLDLVIECRSPGNSMSPALRYIRFCASRRYLGFLTLSASPLNVLNPRETSAIVVKSALN